MALVPHLEQKYASFGSFLPQFEQCVIVVPQLKHKRAGDLNVNDGVFFSVFKVA
jgi:hypothetical protein